MRTLKYWLLGLLLASPAAFALSGNAVATDNVKARLVSEVERHRSGPVVLGRPGIQHSRRLAHLLAQSGRLRPGHQARLAAAAGIHGGRHRLDHAASLRDSAPGELRLCQARRAPGQYHCAQGLAGWARRSCSSAKASWLVCSDVCIPEDADSAIEAAGERASPAPSIRRTRRCSRPRAASCPARNWPPRPRGSRTAGW